MFEVLFDIYVKGEIMGKALPLDVADSFIEALCRHYYSDPAFEISIKRNIENAAAELRMRQEN